MTTEKSHRISWLHRMENVMMSPIQNTFTRGRPPRSPNGFEAIQHRETKYIDPGQDPRDFKALLYICLPNDVNVI